MTPGPAPETLILCLRTFGRVPNSPHRILGRNASGVISLSCFGFIQSQPAFQKRRQHFPPILARARLDVQIVTETAQINRGSLVKGHLGWHFSIAVAAPLLSEKFIQLRFGHTERPPNFFATCEGSGIITPRFMAEKILKPRSFPRFRRFALFHKASRRSAPMKCARSSAG